MKICVLFTKENLMGLGVPGKIIDKYEKDGLLMGQIDFGGTVREVCLAYVPEAKVGDYAIIHVGFAISLLGEEEAKATLALLQEMVDLEAEIGPETAVPPP
jgi:hydrogenase expression/formation protein HypC